MEWHARTLTGLAAGLAAGEFTSVELTQALLSRIEAHDGALNAFVTVTADAALAAAANKPLTPDVIKAVNDKLLATNPDLAASLAASGKTPEDLANEIAAAL